MNRTPSRLSMHFEEVEDSGGRGGVEEGLEGDRSLRRRSGVTAGGRWSGRPGRRRRRRLLRRRLPPWRRRGRR